MDAVELTPELAATAQPIAPALLQLPDYESMSNPNLIITAKAAGYPKAKKWSKNRPIGQKARQEAIEFLMAIALV